jgi:hypothetical protein
MRNSLISKGETMCQSKSEGGARCESHAKKAINDHQLTLNKMVQQECLSLGVMIDPECYALTSEENARVESRVNAEPAVKKAHGDASEATRKRNRMRGTLKEALASGDINRFATLIRQNNPELQAINDDSETRKNKFNANMAKAATESEKDELILQNRVDVALLNKRKEKLNFVSKKEAVAAMEDYRRTGDHERIVHTLTCMKEVTKEIADIRAKSDETIRNERARQKELAIAAKIGNDPSFRDIETSTAFRNTEWYQKWDTKNKELQENYKMTSGYQNEVKAQISAHKAAGGDITEMAAAYKDLTVRKARLAYKNIAQFHGTSSPEANDAASAYHTATQKIHVF